MKFKNVLFVACAALTWSTSSIAQVPGNVPTNGLVGWWPFNGNANDESGNGHDGVPTNAQPTTDRNGLANSAYSFNGLTDYVSIPVSVMEQVSGSFCVALWMKNSDAANQFNGHEVISDRDATSYKYRFRLQFGIAQPQFVSDVTYIDCFEDDQNWNIIFTEVPTVDSWEFYTINYSSENLTFSAYKNGSLIQTLNNVQLVNGSRPINVGRAISPGDLNGTAYYHGAVDDIGIWNRSLTEDEIQALYIGCPNITTSIVGSLEPFALETVQYNCNNNPGSTYEWSISNGVITDGQGTSNVTVLWGSEGPGSLTVIETNADGCSGNAATLDVNVVCATSATAISGPLGPNILTETTYSCDGSTSSAYQWSITNGVITSGQGTNTITVLWGATGLGSVSVQETTSANCMGDVITLNVVAIPTSIEHLSQTAFEAYHQSNLESIVIRSSQSGIGLTYSLFDRIGKQVATGKISNTITNVETNMLTPGVYVLRIGDIYEQSLLIIRE